MKKFSNIIENNNNDYIYSELLAIFYINPEISNFLNSEKNKYLLSSTELNSLMYFEYDKLTINKEIINVNIEYDWEQLIIIDKIATKLRQLIPTYNNIIVNDNNIIIDDNIIKPLSYNDDISDYYNNDILPILYPKLVNILLDYLKPDYLELINKFNIYNINDKISNVGIKIDFLPSLYYNDINSFIKDIVTYKDAFRDYELFLSIWYDIINEYCNSKLSKINIKNYISYNYYTIVDDNIIYLDDNIQNVKYKIDNNYNFYIINYHINYKMYIIFNNTNIPETPLYQIKIKNI